MARPIVGVVAEWLYDAMPGLAAEDGEATGWSLLIWCEGFGQLLEELNLIVRKGPNGEPGWTAVIDPDLATINTIAFAAQNLGIRLRPNDPLSVNQNKVRDASGIYRGTPRAIAGEVQNRGASVVLIYERSASDYSFAVGIFEGEYFARNISFETQDEVDEWFDTGGLPASFTQVTDTTALDGDSYLRITYQDGSLDDAPQLDLRNVASGDHIEVTLSLRVAAGGPDGLVRIVLGDTDAFETSQVNTPLLAAGGDWQEFTIDYDPGSGTTCSLQLVNRTGEAFLLEVDNIQVTSNIVIPATLSIEDIDQAVSLQKPIGMTFTSYLVGLDEWTWFVIGADRYERDLNGFMNITPKPYPTWQDVIDNFATWQDFIDNTPI